MIKKGGIYTRDEEIRVVFEVIDEVVYYYYANDERLKDTVTKEKVDEIIQEDLVVGFFLDNYHSLSEKHFDDLNDGYLGQIDESLLIELQNNHFFIWNSLYLYEFERSAFMIKEGGIYTRDKEIRVIIILFLMTD